MRQELVNARINKKQSVVADDLGISQQHLSSLELGTRNPSIQLAYKISEYYKLPITFLFPDIFFSSILQNELKNGAGDKS